MNTSHRTIAAVAAGSMLALGVAVTQAAATPADTPMVGSGATAPDTQTLQYMREEERLARDLYAALAKQHDGARPMSTITTSEQRHYDAVGTLLTRYGVSDPSAGRPAGSYAFPELQKAYDAWLAKGKTSVNAAYQVGIELEKADIADLEKAIAAATDADVRQVYTSLLKGSNNHLDAFEAAASGKTVGAGQGMRNGRGRQGMQNGQGLQNGQGMQNGRGRQGQGMQQGRQGGQAQTRQGPASRPSSGPANGPQQSQGQRGAGPRDGSCLTDTTS